MCHKEEATNIREIRDKLVLLCELWNVGRTLRVMCCGSLRTAASDQSRSCESNDHSASSIVPVMYVRYGLSRAAAYL